MPNQSAPWYLIHQVNLLCLHFSRIFQMKGYMYLAEKDVSDPHDFTFDLSDPTFHNLLAKKTQAKIIPHCTVWSGR